MSKNKLSPYADEIQRDLYKTFPTTHFLSNPENLDHFFLWNTFFRRNYHRFAIDYLGINLYPYQALTLYEMGVNDFNVIIACRAAAKSFIIALYACIRCILYPNTKILLSSATIKQSQLIVSEKIKNELSVWSPMLKREIFEIKDNDNKTVVKFRNQSQIIVVVASDNARGNRSNCIVREEFRQISKNIDDSVLSPCQVTRMTPYMMNNFYATKPELEEEPVDIYITSSWIDNGHWMWKIVDNAYDQMKNGERSCLLAFDESVVLKHKIKLKSQLLKEKKKQDPMTWKLEFLNCRLKENQSAFFTYTMLNQNQTIKQVFYPRLAIDVRSNKKNPYAIPKQQGEVRIVACDMAFIENKGNDNSVFSCIRALPETKRYGNETEVSNGYRRIVSYMEAVQGGDTVRQSRRIRQLYEDFSADYIVLDLRNAGCSIYDNLARVMYDEERNIEYSALSCMNDEKTANRIKTDGAKPCIFVINATQNLNSEIALDFRQILEQKKIEFLVSFDTAQEEILPYNKDYISEPEAEAQLFYEKPFLETQAFISECIELVYEKKESTGAIVLKEQGNNTKDRWTSISYGSYFISLLEKDLFSVSDEYECEVFVN